MFNRILVPTDFTPKCENALKTAVQLAKKTGSTIDLMHIVESPLIIKNKNNFLDGISNLAKEMMEISAKKLTFLRDQFADEDITINIRTKIDELPDRVAELITQEDYDLIVVGGNTVYPFYEFVGKTHPEQIVELAKCPVLVLNKEIESFNMDRIVIPSSLDNSIVKIMDQINEMIDFFRADVEILYVNTPASFKTTDEINKAWHKFKSVHELDNVRLSLYNDHSVKKGIVKYAKDQGVDLILLTSKHTKKPLSVIKGDITEHIVNHEDFPVLTFNIKNTVL
ncbi:MAG: universal stress protein [Bacteroidota bacterium]